MKNKILVAILIIFFAATVFGGSLQVSSTSTDPNPGIPGQYITLWVNMTNNSVENAADALVNLKLKSDDAETTFPFSFETGDSGLRQLGTIEPYKTAVARYRVLVDPNALDGTYTIFAETGDDGKIRQAVPVSIKILSRKPDIKIIASYPDSAKIGKTVSLDLTIKNTGSSGAFDIALGASEERTVTSTGIVVGRSIIPLGAAFSYLPGLDAGQTATVNLKFVVNPDAETMGHYIPIQINFLDSNRTAYTSTGYIGLKVEDDPELGATVSDITQVLSPGVTTEITIDIYNTGAGTAHDLLVSTDSNLISAKQSEFYIGSLDSDNFDSVVLKGTVSSASKPGMYPIVLSLSYKNAFGETTTVQKTVNVQIYSAEAAAAQSGADGLLAFSGAEGAVQE